MKHVTLRSSSATNAGSGQASGKHSQLSLPFPFCHCCHPQFLTQFLCVCVPQLQSERWTASELRAHWLVAYGHLTLCDAVTFSLYYLLVFFLYFVFVFRFVCGFTDCREAFARLFSPCFVFFSVFFVTCEVVKVKIDFHFIAACAWGLHKGWAKGGFDSRLCSFSAPSLSSLTLSRSLAWIAAIYGMFYEWILFELNAHFFGV